MPHTDVGRYIDCDEPKEGRTWKKEYDYPDEQRDVTEDEGSVASKPQRGARSSSPPSAAAGSSKELEVGRIPTPSLSLSSLQMKSHY